MTDPYANIDLRAALGDPDTYRDPLEPSLRQAVGKNPAQEVRAEQLSKFSGLPKDQVEYNRAQIEADEKYAKIDLSSLRDLPGLSDYLVNPDNASKVHEDLPNLIEIERGLLNSGSRLMGERVGEIAGNFMTFLDQVYDLPFQMFPILDELGGPVLDPEHFGGYIPRWAGKEELQKIIEESGTAFSRTSDILKQIDLDAQKMHTPETIKRAFSDPNTGKLTAIGEVFGFIVESGIESIPDMAAAAFALAPYVASLSAGIGEERAENKGVKHTLKETLEAAPFAIGSALLERIMPKGVVDKLGGDVIENVGKEIMKEGFKQGGIEAFTEFVQEGAIEYLGERLGTGADMSWEEAVEQGFFGALAGGPTGAVMGGGSVGAKALMDRVTARRENGKIEQSILDAISEKARLSAEDPNGLANLDPEGFRQLVRKQAEGSSRSEVYMSAEAVQEALSGGLTQEQLDLPAIRKILEQMPEALSMKGADIIIPIEDVMTDIATDESLYSVLRDSMRLSPESLTEKDVEREGEAIDKQFKDLTEEASQNADHAQEVEKFKKQIIDYIEGSDKVPPAAKMAARESAEILAAAYNNLGGRDSNMTMEQFARDFGFVIEGEREIRSGDVTVLNQDPAYKDAELIYEEFRDSFLDKMPEDASIDEVMDNLDQFTPQEQSLLKAFDRDSWLGFDYPSQAISAAMSGTDSINQFDPSPGLKNALGRLVNRPGAVADAQQFGDLELTEEVELSETGEQLTISQPAQRQFDQAVKRRKAIESLRDCLNG